MNVRPYKVSTGRAVITSASIDCSEDDEREAMLCLIREARKEFRRGQPLRFMSSYMPEVGGTLYVVAPSDSGRPTVPHPNMNKPEWFARAMVALQKHPKRLKRQRHVYAPPARKDDAWVEGLLYV